jgi:hypothetical protein
MCQHYKDQLFDAVQLQLRMPDGTRNCADWAKCGVTFGILTAILWFRLVEVYRRFRVTSSENFVLFIKLHDVTPQSVTVFKIQVFNDKARGNYTYHIVLRGIKNQ